MAKMIKAVALQLKSRKAEVRENIWEAICALSACLTLISFFQWC